MASHGRYTILGKLADGGMAEIFLATQHGAEGFQKPVVLKRRARAEPMTPSPMTDSRVVGMASQRNAGWVSTLSCAMQRMVALRKYSANSAGVAVRRSSAR